MGLTRINTSRLMQVESNAKSHLSIAEAQPKLDAQASRLMPDRAT